MALFSNSILSSSYCRLPDYNVGNGRTYDEHFLGLHTSRYIFAGIFLISFISFYSNSSIQKVEMCATL